MEIILVIMHKNTYYVYLRNIKKIHAFHGLANKEGVDVEHQRETKL